MHSHLKFLLMKIFGSTEYFHRGKLVLRMVFASACYMKQHTFFMFSHKCVLHLLLLKSCVVNRSEISLWFNDLTGVAGDFIAKWFVFLC